jgi:hypothetical protein
MPERRKLLLIALLVGLLSACADTTPPAAEKPPAAPEPIGPRGAVSIPFTFAWKPVPGGSWIYRVSVTDAAERVLFEQDVREPKCWPGKELKSMMADHATFSWTVAVMSSDGARVLARSEPVAFSLK